MSKTDIENLEDAQRNNGLGNSESVEDARPKTQDPKNRPVGGRKPRAPANPSERAMRRRNSLTDLDGLLREHARIIAAMFAGKIGLERGETLSRAMARQAAMLSTVEEKAILLELKREAQSLRKLKELQRVAHPAQLIGDVG